jgi:hypothetical protein
MAVDRYTKLVLTVIAVCLVWLSFGGRTVITPVAAQADGVLLRGWVDAKGAVISFPTPIPERDYSVPRIGGDVPTKPRTVSPLPVDQ